MNVADAAFDGELTGFANAIKGNEPLSAANSDQHQNLQRR
jgi:hypothetical protein